MKNIRKIIIICLIFILSGCSVEYNLNINEDYSISEKVVAKEKTKKMESYTRLKDKAATTYLFNMYKRNNSKIANDLLNTNMVEKNEANKLIYVCYFSNPLFLYNMLSLIFNNQTIVIKLIISHYISNIITLFLIRNKYIPKTSNKFTSKRSSLNKILPKTCQKAMNNMIIVLGILSFYILVTSYLPSNSLIKGLFEITTGLNSLMLNQSEYKEILTIIIINFGGLSIFTQIKSILEDTNLNFYNYFKGRLYQIVISIILLIVL